MKRKRGSGLQGIPTEAVSPQGQLERLRYNQGKSRKPKSNPPDHFKKN